MSHAVSRFWCLTLAPLRTVTFPSPHHCKGKLEDPEPISPAEKWAQGWAAQDHKVMGLEPGALALNGYLDESK
jgi:hypothetical protein